MSINHNNPPNLDPKIEDTAFLNNFPKEHVPDSFLEICLDRINYSRNNQSLSCDCMGLNEKDVVVLNKMGYTVTQKKYWNKVDFGE